MADRKKRRGQFPGKNGRPPHVPTDDNAVIVRTGTANGVPVRILALMLGIDEVTLRKYYADHIADARERTKASLGIVLVREAMRGNVGALKYWMSLFGGPEWRVVDQLAIGGLVNAPPIALATSEPPRIVIVLPDNQRGRDIA